MLWATGRYIARLWGRFQRPLPFLEYWRDEMLASSLEIRIRKFFQDMLYLAQFYVITDCRQHVPGGK